MNALVMSPDKLNDFCDFLLAQGRRLETVSAYRRKLRTLYTFLPEDKALTEQSVQRYIAWLREKYKSPQTINTYISSMNSFLQHYGCRGLCAPCGPDAGIAAGAVSGGVSPPSAGGKAL